MKGSKILNQIRVIFVICMVLLLSSQIANSATYYIDYDSGNDANNGTSKSAPWKRSPGMYGFAGSYTHSNGDVFVFKGGVTWPYVSGSSILVIQNSGGGVGTEDVYTGGNNPSYNWGTGYPIFDGGNPVSATLSGISTNTKSNIIIEYIKVTNIGESTSGSGVGISSAYGGSNLHIRYNYLDSNSVNAFQYSPNTATPAYQDIYFHHNTIRRAGRVYCVLGDGRVSNVNFYNNTMEGGWDYDNHAYHVDGFFFGADGVDDYGIQNLNVYNNRWWGDWAKGGTAYIYLSGTSDGSKKGCKNVLIYNNIIAPSNISGTGGSTANGIIIKWGHDTVSLYNNTLDYRSIINKGSYGILYYTYVANITVKNNIIAGFDNAVGFSNVSGTNVIDSNAFYSNTHLIWDQTTSNRYNTCSAAQAAGWGTSFCSVADPKFTTNITPADNDDAGYGISNGNLTLQSDSPAKDAGADLSAYFTTDLSGNSRSGAWDIGAYEYGATNKSTLVVTSVNGTVASNPSGINCGLTCSADYESGTSVTLTASPNSGYTFAGWLGGGCSGTGTCTVTMNEATFVTASYTIPVYNLTVTKSGTGTGTVTGSDGLINCGSTCSVNYESGKSVTLTAVTGSGSIFSGWSGACTGTGTCTVSMTAAKSVTATFIPVYTLTVTKSVAAAGTVTSSDSKINCGSTCTATYYPEATVTLTASPNSGYTFTGWSGGGCSGTGTCTVTMNAAASVTAYFATTVYKLTVTKSGTGTGTVTGSDGLINCGSTCSVNYESGKSVTLTAVAGSGSIFSGWSGACTGTGTCTVSMTSAKTVTATFTTSVLFKLTVRKSISKAGTITANDGGINCGSICSANYGSGKSVTLTASANSGYKFYKWAGACTGTGTCTVKMTAAKNATAYYLLSW